MAQQYFRIGVQHGFIQFHTGTDRRDVSEMNSLNRGIKLSADEERITEYINEWWEDVKLFELTPA